MARHPRDRRYPERLTASYIASLLLHASVAALLFTVAMSSSQEGATQDNAGGEVISVSHTVAVSKPVPVQSAQPPVPSAPKIAPIHHAPVVLAASQPQPPRRREIAHIDKTATAAPMPTPVPQATVRPNPVPTVAVVEPSPAPEIPSVPIPVPSAMAVAVTIKFPPTAAPSPRPTAVPTVVPTVRPAPSAVPTKTPSTPAPAPSAAPKLVPTAAPVARATKSPATPAPPGPQASLPPAKVAGVPSPSPTKGPSITKAAGTQPTPGPKGTSAPGPRAGSAVTNKPGPSRPVTVTPTIAPASNPGTRATQNKAGRDLNAFLRSLIPTGPATVSSKTYNQGYKAVPTNLEPSPPPDVLARTIYLYTNARGEERSKMWVTSIRKEGMVTFCTGWLVRYPRPPNMATLGGTAGTGSPISGLLHPTISTGQAGFRPIIEPNVTYICEAHTMTPFVPPSAPSPAP